MTELTKITWCIGSMREGDTRSTIRTSISALGNHVQAFAQALEKVDLVMGVGAWGSIVHAKLDIGDKHSRVLPWANRPTPTTQEAWNHDLQLVEDEAEKVALAAHRLLTEMVPGIHPVPVIEHDWVPLRPQEAAPNAIITY